MATTYFCNKCGYVGPGGPEHPGKGCRYLAVKVESFTCTEQKPWTKEMGEPDGSSHPDAEEVIFHDCWCCQHYRCPNCHLEWKSDRLTDEPCKGIGAALVWKDKEHGPEAIVGDFEKDDGIRFSIMHMPSCYRRGPYRLLIEVKDKNKEWGCFDDQDQPMRYYHSLERLKEEAQEISNIISNDHERKVNGPLPGDPGSMSLGEAVKRGREKMTGHREPPTPTQGSS